MHTSSSRSISWTPLGSNGEAEGKRMLRPQFYQLLWFPLDLGAERTSTLRNSRRQKIFTSGFLVKLYTLNFGRLERDGCLASWLWADHVVGWHSISASPQGFLGWERMSFPMHEQSDPTVWFSADPFLGPGLPTKFWPDAPRQRARECISAGILFYVTCQAH